MAAVVHPISHDRRIPPRPDLRLIPGGRRPERPASRVPHAVYVRRRLLAAGALAGLLWLAWVALAAVGGAPLVASGASPATRPAAARVHVVQPGETLWSIARGLDRGGDVRDTVQWLAAHNGGSALRVGQQLVLP